MELAEKKMHYVVATGIVIKENKYLIVKRAMHEKAFPGRWTVPGGKLNADDYINEKFDTKDKLWYNVFEKLVRREIFEETGLKIKNIRYLVSLAYIRPDKYPCIIISLYCDYDSGNVILCGDLEDYAWVDIEQAKHYDLIDGIYDELVMLDNVLKGNNTEWRKP